MKYPNVTFKKISLKENIDIVRWMYNQNDSLDTRKKVIDYFPGINEKTVDNQVTDMFESVSNVFEKFIGEYETNWNSISDDYFKDLFDYLSIDEYEDNITVYVGLMPIAPRDIQNRKIFLNIGMEKNKLLNILTHEILHFLWINKIESLFPNISSDDFNSPSLPWIYSELITPIILNRESIVKLTSLKEDREYDFMSDEVMSSIQQIFNKNTSIDSRIKEGFEFINNYFTNKLL